MADKNFSVKWTHTEATDVAWALEEQLRQMLSKPLNELTNSDKIVIGRLQTILRRDFDING